MRRDPGRASSCLLVLARLRQAGRPASAAAAHAAAAVANFRLAQRGDQLEIRYTAPRASGKGPPSPSSRWRRCASTATGTSRSWAAAASGGRRRGKTWSRDAPLPAPGTVVRVAGRAMVGKEPSPRSGPLVLRVQPPLAAPSDLAAQIVPEGIALAWKGEKPAPVAPPATPSPSPSPGRPALPGPSPAASPVPTPPPFPGGFSVYRRPANGDAGPPLTARPTEERKLTDTAAALGTRWCYTVRAVAAPEPLVESGSVERGLRGREGRVRPGASRRRLRARARRRGRAHVEPVPRRRPRGIPRLAGGGWGDVPRVSWRCAAGRGSTVDSTAIRGTTYRLHCDRRSTRRGTRAHTPLPRRERALEVLPRPDPGRTSVGAGGRTAGCAGSPRNPSRETSDEDVFLRLEEVLAPFPRRARPRSWPSDATTRTTRRSSTSPLPPSPCSS